jgi:hypothetical protein
MQVFQGELINEQLACTARTVPYITTSDDRSFSFARSAIQTQVCSLTVASVVNRQGGLELGVGYMSATCLPTVLFAPEQGQTRVHIRLKLGLRDTWRILDEM